MLQHFIIQFSLYYLSRVRLREVENKRKFRFSSKRGSSNSREVVAYKETGRFAPSPFRPRSFRPNLKSFRPNPKSFRPNPKSFRPDLGNWSKQLYSNRTHLCGRRGGSQRHHLSSNITNIILLAVKFELTQKYSASKSQHYSTNKKREV